ncbi:MAG: hypothetical protein PHG49_01880 [Candidatus Pacebacteria bacterium]|nr:hypothetical protein [Candidatus Paceibacterota bacterium]
MSRDVGLRLYVDFENTIYDKSGNNNQTIWYGASVDRYVSTNSNNTNYAGNFVESNSDFVNAGTGLNDLNTISMVA